MRELGKRLAAFPELRGLHQWIIRFCFFGAGWDIEREELFENILPGYPFRRNNRRILLSRPEQDGENHLVVGIGKQGPHRTLWERDASRGPLIKGRIHIPLQPG